MYNKSIAIKNDQNEWTAFDKKEFSLADDIFINKREPNKIEQLSIQEAKQKESFDVYTYYSNEEYDDDKLFMFADEILSLTAGQEQESLIVYYALNEDASDEKTKSKVVIKSTQRDMVEYHECEDELSLYDVIDLAGYKSASLEIIAERETDQSKKYSV